MAKVKNILGQKFGKLTVISLCEDRGNSGQIMYNCVCDCGNSHRTSGHSIRSGRSKSCGCNRLNYIPKTFNKDRKEQILIQLYKSTIEKRSKSKGWDVCIDFNVFKKLSLSNCFYCGINPISKIDDRKKDNNKTKISDEYIYVNGIDRMDSDLGYTVENSVSCCKYCNTAKNNMRIDDFKKWIRRVYEYNF